MNNLRLNVGNLVTKYVMNFYLQDNIQIFVVLKNCQGKKYACHYFRNLKYNFKHE